MYRTRCPREHRAAHNTSRTSGGADRRHDPSTILEKCPQSTTTILGALTASFPEVPYALAVELGDPIVARWLGVKTG